MDINELLLSMCEALESFAYANDQDNKSKINCERELYPCKKCIHCIDDNGYCNIGVGYKCIREPEKYWKAKED